MEKADVFLCYRRYGAQTAKLFKRYLTEQNFPGIVWYSDSEPLGNYKQDPTPLIEQAECAVLFIDKEFTRDFLNSNTPRECITALEMIAIAKKKASNPAFALFTIFLDRENGFTIEESCVLEALFTRAELEDPAGTVLLFSQNNTIFFSTALGDEKALVQNIAQKLLPNDFYRRNLARGNFFFGSLPTYVDILLWDIKNGIDPDNVAFSLDPMRVPTHDKVSRFRGHLEYEVQNNQMVSLLGVNTVLSDNDEEKIVDIRYKTVEYKLFYKTLKLWEQLNMDTVISNYRWQTDIYPIPNAMGLAFMVITADGKMIFTKRSSARQVRPNEYDCSIVEGLKIEGTTGCNLHYSISDDGYLRNEIIRAFREEVCSDEEGLQTKVTGLVLDKEYGQWNVIGTIHTPHTAAEIMHLHALRSDTYEVNDIYFIPFQDQSGALSTQLLKKHFPEYLRGKIWGMALAVTCSALLDVGFSNDEIQELSRCLT